MFRPLPRSTVRCLLLLAGLCGTIASAQADEPAAVLELRFTPAPRAQIAIWLEDSQGRFLRTLALTEAVAYRGIGNRPGASQMNSGYRWPYGRREGALPIWASRRAAAPSALQFQRVIFQNRTAEGMASRTSSDQSVDDYYCLSFDRTSTTRDALDAVSCASPSRFASDKGRFITQDDIAVGYGEPWQDPASGNAMRAPLGLTSLYPPRMDAEFCDAASCFDHADLLDFASHARSVMPEIDAITMATPPGAVEQSLLFSLPAGWPAGRYVAWLEINVEGDYNETFNDSTYPTPTHPVEQWDSWATTYGYPYRGQPSVAFSVPFELDGAGDEVESTSEPVGRSSWDMHADDYGALEAMSGIRDDPAAAPGSGADRLMLDADGARLWLIASTFGPLEEAEDGEDPFAELPPIDSSSDSQPPPGTEGEPESDQAADAESDDEQVRSADRGARPSQDDTGEGVVLRPDSQEESEGPIGSIEGLQLRHHGDELHSHEWIAIRFRAARSEQPLHRYEVRVGTAPIVNESSFLRNGRPAKTATTDPEGAVMLMLPREVPAGQHVEGEIGNLVASTRYFVAVRAVDRRNRRGPISVAQITTTERTFATVTPCVVATAAYGSPLAREVSVLRRMRDRYLMSHAAGKALVQAYYAHGPRLAALVRRWPVLRGAVREALSPLVRLARLLEREEQP